ncbi:MAG: purine-nucleoside phosphorylase [Anaerolineaceae bacterium]|nr:purine-nucleoside phosphorylase [Anaerolineaceae bacterium]
MSEFITMTDIDRAVDAIRSRIDVTPEIGMILGTGLGPLADSVDGAMIIPNQEIPCWPISTVQGHKGRLVIGELEGKTVFILQGRTHFYEGYSMGQTTFSVRVMKRLGCETLVVTNAAGAINPDYVPGDLMLITDHINLIGMGGSNPLFGPNMEEFGVRFPDMSQPYDKELLAKAREACDAADIPYQEGVYVGLAGPSFETPAELRFLKAIGADAVGMSTVPEVIVARHSGMRVLGISGISNKANLDGSTMTTHEEVLEAGRVLVPKLTGLIRGTLSRL